MARKGFKQQFDTIGKFLESHSLIERFHSFLREYNDKDMAAMLVSLTMDANKKSFVHGTPTWRR
jgi:hypothetical protein